MMPLAYFILVDLVMTQLHGLKMERYWMHWEILMMVPIGMFQERLKQQGIIFFKENLISAVVILATGIHLEAVLMKVALKLVMR